MVNFVIIDDNIMHRKRVYNIICTYMMDNNVDFKIYEFNDIDDKINDYIDKNIKNSIYILDLELPSHDGIDAATRVKNKNNDWVSPIIILTAHGGAYYKSYKERLQLLDFVCKSEDFDSILKINFDICMRILDQMGSYKFTYKNIGYKIPYLDIDYIQRDDRRTKIVTRTGELYQNISINDIKKELPGYFALSLKGTLINKKNIFKIDWNKCIVYFRDGNSGYLISKKHKKEFDEYVSE